MKLNPPDALLVFLKQYRRFLILGHGEPDGDCLGSQLGMALLVRKLGARAVLLSPGPFRRPEIQEYSSRFQNRIPEDILKDIRESGPAGSGWAVLIMDCSTPERIGPELQEDIRGLPVAVIDHHASGADFGSVRWIEPKAPAVTVLVHRLYTLLDLPVEKEEAELLFLGLCTDTGYFRHLEEGSEDTFLLASRLVEAGVNPKGIFNRMHGNRSLESRILLGRLLARTESWLEGRVLSTWESLEEKRTFGPENRDSDILYQQLQSVRNCEAVLLIREESETERSVGIRTREAVDAGQLASERGGGGHKRAAGYNTTLSRQEILQDLLPRIEAILS